MANTAPLSGVLEALAQHLQDDLGALDSRLKSRLQVRPMHSGELLKQPNQDLCIVTSLARMSYEFGENIQSLRLLSVLPYSTPSRDTAGLLAVDMVSALVASLRRFGPGAAPGVLEAPQSISAENLSLPQRALSLWGVAYTLELRASAIVPDGAEIGQFVTAGALGAFLQAGGNGPLIDQEIQVRN